MNWSSFSPADFEYDFERDELTARRITFEEAVECFFQILKFAETKAIVIGINCLARRLAAENLRSFFN